MIEHDQNLITQAGLENLEATAVAANDALATHAAMAFTDVHQGWVQTNQSTFDSVLDKTGRNAIQIQVKIAGGSYVSYLLPADTRSLGPPQLARIVTQPTNILSTADGGTSFPMVQFTCQVEGTPPYTFQWQLFNVRLLPGTGDKDPYIRTTAGTPPSPGTWVDIVTDTYYPAANVNSLDSNIKFAAPTSTDIASNIKTSEFNVATHGSSHGIPFNYIAGIRCKVTNDAGSVYTTVGYISLLDKT
jgi:hypothetical protein